MAGKRRQRGSNRREMICISLVVLALLGVVAVQSNRLRDKNAGYEAKIELLNEQIQEESERASEIAELKEYVSTKEYAAQAAKEKLGMVGENEILFKAEN